MKLLFFVLSFTLTWIAQAQEPAGYTCYITSSNFLLGDFVRRFAVVECNDGRTEIIDEIPFYDLSAEMLFVVDKLSYHPFGGYGFLGQECKLTSMDDKYFLSIDGVPISLVEEGQIDNGQATITKLQELGVCLDSQN